MAEHNSFLVYKDNIALVENCTDEQAGQLFKALFAFACYGEELDTDDRMLKGFYSVFRNSIVRDDAKYQERCRKNQENGSKGGRPKKQNEPIVSKRNQSVSIGYEENQSQAKKADSDIGSVSDSDSVLDSESVRGKGAGETPLPETDSRQQELMAVFNEKRRQWQNREEQVYGKETG